MDYFQVEKTEGLFGEINIQGAKNSVLPMIVASILTRDVVVITNCPDITDVHNMIRILDKLNCRVSFENNTLEIDSRNVKNISIDEELMSKTRGAVLFLGALIGRFKESVISFPGGCKIGSRPLDIHIEAFKKLNIAISDDNCCIEAYTDLIKGNTVFLRYPSVGATENIMIAAAISDGVTIIENPAREPEIIDLQDFINSLGGNIKGAGSGRITIRGVKKLKGSNYRVMGDRIVAATYMAAVAAVSGRIRIEGISHNYLKSEINILRKMGCYVKCRKKYIVVSRDRDKDVSSVLRFETNPYPAFATDAGPAFLASLLKADGISIMTENIFESRFEIVKEFVKLGAAIAVLDGNISVINGKKHLYGTDVYAGDLRGGAALVIAGLCAEGRTNIFNIHYIQRGYEDIVRDLRKIGANIWIKKKEVKKE